MDYEKDEIQGVVISDNSGISVAGVEETAVSAGIIYMPEGYTADNVTYNDDGTVTVVVDSQTYTGTPTASLPTTIAGSADSPAIVVGFSGGTSGGVYTGKTVKIEYVIFAGNGSDSSNNGGVINSGSFNVSNSRFENNTAKNGGVFDLWASTNSYVFTSSTFSKNKASSYGGVISVRSYGGVTVKDGIFSDNTAGTGGAIYYKNTQEALSLTVVNGTEFINNKAANGGAIFIDAATIGAVTIDEAVFGGNTSNDTKGVSGAIYNKASVAITGSTFLTSSDTIYLYAGSTTAASLYFYGKNIINANVTSYGTGTLSIIVSDEDIYDEETGELLHSATEFVFHDYSSWDNYEDVNSAWAKGNITVAKELAGAKTLQFNGFAGETLSVEFSNAAADDFKNTDVYFKNIGTVSVSGIIAAGAKSLMFDVSGDSNSMTFSDKQEVAGEVYINVTAGTLTAGKRVTVAGNFLDADVGTAAYQVNGADVKWSTAYTLGVATADNTNYLVYKDGINLYLAEATGDTEYTPTDMAIVNGTAYGDFFTATVGDTTYISSSNKESVTIAGTVENLIVSGIGNLGWSGGNKAASISNVIFANWNGEKNAVLALTSGTNTEASLSLTDVEFYGNTNNDTGNTTGGAVYIYKIPVFNASNTKFLNNKAKHGGAVSFDTAGAVVSMDGVLFSGNSATNNGGAVYNRNIKGTVEISNANFSNNTAKNGGAIYSVGTLTISNTSFLTNTDTVYSAGSLTLKGNITTAAEFKIDGSTVVSNVTYNGTAKAEDAAITLDHSAENKAGYISNLAAFSDGSTYTLSALLAEGVKNGIYTLAGGASSYADTITVKNSTGSIVENLAVGSTTGKDGIIYSLAVNDSAELILTVTDKLVLDGTGSTDDKGNYTNTTGASVVVDGAVISNNLYAAANDGATLTVEGGNIKNIFAGAKFENGGETGDITATVGGRDITTTRIYGGNAVLGGTVETVNTTLTISGALIYQDQSTGVWCYGAGIAASQTKDGTTTSGTLKIAGTSKVEVTAPGPVGSIVGGGRAQNSGSLEVGNTYVTISNATVTNAIGGAYNSGSGSVTIGTAEMTISSRNVTTVFGGNFIAPVSDGVLSNVNSIDNVKLTINGAVASNAIFGGNYMKAGSAEIGTVTININGADSACGIYGGGFIVGAASEMITNVNISVSGTVVGNIFAGACVSGEGGSSTVEKATITVSGIDSNISGNIYAGGYSVNGTAAVEACTITFSGNQSYFNYNGKVCAASAGSVKTAAPQATVVFDKYVGDFGGAFAGTFGVIEFTADSSVNFASKDFDGLKTGTVQITGMDTVTYSADADHVLFDLADSCDFDINRISVDGATLQSGISESSFTYFWNESTQEFGYAGAEAIANFKDKDSYSFYQLTIA